MIDESYQLDSTTSFKSHWKDFVTEFGSYNHVQSDNYVEVGGNGVGMNGSKEDNTHMKRYCSSYIQRQEDVDRQDWTVELIITAPFGFRQVPATGSNVCYYGMMIEYNANSVCQFEVTFKHDDEGDLYLRLRMFYITPTAWGVYATFRDYYDWTGNLTPDVISFVSNYHAEIRLKVRMMTANSKIVFYPYLTTYDLIGSAGLNVLPLSTDYHSSTDGTRSNWKSYRIYPYIGAYNASAYGSSCYVHVEKVTLQ